MPGPGSPVVLPHLACAVHAHLNGRYRDPVWPLAPLTENPSAARPKIHWENWPSCFRDEMRLAAWNLVNGQLRPTFLLGHGSRMRGRLGAHHVHATTEQWKLLAAWLEQRGIRRLADCTADVLHDYGQHARDAGHGRNHVLKTLAALTRPWEFDQLSASPSGIGKPPWEELGIDGYQPAAGRGGGENTTEPLAEQTIGPLLVWAMRMTEDLSGDILRTAAPHLGRTRRRRHHSGARRPGGIPPAPDRQRRAPALDPPERQGRPRPPVRGRHHRGVIRAGQQVHDGQPAVDCGGPVRAVPAERPRDRPHRGKALAARARLQRGPLADAPPGHGSVP